VHFGGMRYVSQYICTAVASIGYGKHMNGGPWYGPLNTLPDAAPYFNTAQAVLKCIGCYHYFHWYTLKVSSAVCVQKKELVCKAEKTQCIGLASQLIFQINFFESKKIA
jgi:hypothetical protein